MNKSLLSYRGYDAYIHFDSNDCLLYGRIEGIMDSISFHSDSTNEIEAEFHRAVDDYIMFCDSVGKEPEKPFKGLFNVRVKPTLHRKLFLEASAEGVAMNTVVERAISEHFDKAGTLHFEIKLNMGDMGKMATIPRTDTNYRYKPLQLIEGGAN